MTTSITGLPTTAISRLTDEIARRAAGLQEEDLEKLAAELARLFSVKKDEVALLEVSYNGAVLNFLYPLALRKVGQIPMTTSNSLAVRTAREKRPEMINNFTAQKHPTIFEAVVLDPEQERFPIQKIMSAPLLLDSKAHGVVQISRKGRTGMAAGADFTVRDLTILVATAGLMAKCLKK